ncbi:MAG: dihydrofolate synthase / folylpolyglutamate synthase [Frankiaceae bacterium]|nr:dihydrofolate synthase / folylpolyglutamate synthase [Frankiaceae bacterium]
MGRAQRLTIRRVDHELDELARVERLMEARGPAHINPGLERIEAVLHLLGDPQRAYPSIHIGGTNGKTSTARMAEALLRSAGLRTGRYTSPHLVSVTERISVDGEALSPGAFAALYDDVAPYASLVDAEHPAQPVTYFELMTAMAFAAFADAPVDAAVVEVGLGGTWDCTNVVAAPVAALLPISLDHTELLGDTVGQIAADKAGIVHEGALLVLAAQPLEAAEVILRRVAEVGATVAREGLEYGVLSRALAVGGQLVTLQGLHGVYDDVLLPLHGSHQAANAAVALATVEGLLGRPLDVELVRDALGSVTSPGRLEVVRRNPTIVVDAAHNPAGMAVTAAAIRDAFDFTRLVAVVGVLADKDARGILEALEPAADVVLVTRSSSPRALPVDELAGIAVEVLGADRVETVGSLAEALDRAVEVADEHFGSGVLVTGSITLAGDARRLLPP